MVQACFTIEPCSFGRVCRESYKFTAWVQLSQVLDVNLFVRQAQWLGSTNITWTNCSGTSSHLLLLRQQVSCKPCCFGYADLRRFCPAAIWFAERHLPSSNCSLSYIDSAKPLTHGTKHGSSRDKLSVLERDTLASKPPSHVCAKENKKAKQIPQQRHTHYTLEVAKN